METGGIIGLQEPHIPQARLRSYQGVIKKTENWRTLGVSEEEVRMLEGMEEDETDQEMARAAG
jgi:phthalate 4,5-dioxygenase oxygenase subunit